MKKAAVTSCVLLLIISSLLIIDGMVPTWNVGYKVICGTMLVPKF